MVEGRKLEVQSSFSFHVVTREQIEQERTEQRAKQEALSKTQASELRRMQERSRQEMKRMQEEIKKRHEEFFKNAPKQFRDELDFFDDPFPSQGDDDGGNR
jgi:hypothetical protein